MEIKITRKLLKNHRKNKHEIPVLEYELNQMKTTDYGIGNSTIFDYRDGYARPQSVVGFDRERYERREKALERKKDEAKAVENWINSIEDGQTRCVFRMRYIDGMEWVKIAVQTGYGGAATIQGNAFAMLILKNRHKIKIVRSVRSIRCRIIIGQKAEPKRPTILIILQPRISVSLTLPYQTINSKACRETGISVHSSMAEQQ